MNITPFVIAFLGAAFGAYFAILKSRTERLWLERFETLNSICLSANTITHFHEAKQMEEMGVSVMSQSEMEELNHEFFQVRSDLRNSIARMQLLFSEKDVKQVIEIYFDMNGAITELYNMSYNEDRLESVTSEADDLLQATIKLTQTKLSLTRWSI